MNSILQQILHSKRREIEAAQAVCPLAKLRQQAEQLPPPRDFFGTLAQSGPIRLIAELKRASPSQGVIRQNFDPQAIARDYAAAGASCLSVLTDQKYFHGHLEYLSQVRAAVSLPLLRKDFIVDRYQVWEARCAGADAVLLIAECLDDCRLRSLYAEIVDLGMTPLVELYSEENCVRVLDLGATLIGINNRNLDTFEVDLRHTLRLRDRIPRNCLLVSESGIHSRADVRLLESAGVDAILVGEHFMRQSDIRSAVRQLLYDEPLTG